MLFSRKKKLKTYQEDNPNKKLELSLNELDWQHCETPERQKAWQMIKKSQIENLFLKQAIEKMDYRSSLGGYVYTNYDRRLERTSPSIVCKTKHNKFFRIVKI